MFALRPPLSRIVFFLPHLAEKSVTLSDAAIGFVSSLVREKARLFARMLVGAANERSRSTRLTRQCAGKATARVPCADQRQYGVPWATIYKKAFWCQVESTTGRRTRAGSYRKSNRICKSRLACSRRGGSEREWTNTREILKSDGLTRSPNVNANADQIRTTMSLKRCTFSTDTLRLEPEKADSIFSQRKPFFVATFRAPML